MDYREMIPAIVPDLHRALFLPVLARAIESAKSNPLMIDDAAVDIIKKADPGISKMASSIPEFIRITWVVRSLYFERIIEDFLRRYPDGTVVNIGCGLDTLYERVSNSSVQWYDIDQTDIIKLRSLFLNETSNRKLISASFIDTRWFKKIEYKEHVMFVAAGSFYFFEEKRIKKFLARLCSVFPSAEVVFDITSPAGMMFFNRAFRNTFCGNRQIRWAVRDIKKLLAWPPGFRLLGKYHTYNYEGLSLNAGNRILGLIIDFLDIQCIIHLKVRFNYKYLRDKKIRLNP